MSETDMTPAQTAERARAAYSDYLLDLASRGIIDDALTDVDVEGKAIEERMVDAL